MVTEELAQGSWGKLEQRRGNEGNFSQFPDIKETEENLGKTFTIQMGSSGNILPRPK